MTLPNLISLARLLAVPVIIALIVSGAYEPAFWLFIAAGVSDAADGIIARRFGLGSELGAYLDPIADKALLVSIYVSLGVTGGLPAWLVILVAARDILIVGGVVLAWIMDRPVAMKPLAVSKVNTAAQIVLAAIVLGEAALDVSSGGLRPLLVWAVAGLTAVSTVAYLMEWAGHMTRGAQTPLPKPFDENRPEGTRE